MANDPLCQLEEVKRWLKFKPAEVNQDELLDDLIESCSQQIAEYCGRDNLGAIGTYSENRTIPSSSGARPNGRPRLLLNMYPVTLLTSVIWNNTSITILTPTQIQFQQAGVFLEDDLRTLTFLGLWMPQAYGYVQVNYSAGYQLIGAESVSQATPGGLRRACIQWVAELYKASEWIGYKSKSLAGETVTFEGGDKWGMSPRTKAMLQPYVNRMPPYLT